MTEEVIHKKEPEAANTQAAEQREEAPTAKGGPLSPAAMAAFARFLDALNEEDKQVLTGLLTRFREMAAESLAAAQAAEEEAMLAAMEEIPVFAGIRGRTDAMHALIAQVPWLRSLPLRDRLAAACYIDRGMQQHTPTPEEKLQAVLSDPALLRALAEKQAALRAAQARGTPPAVGTGLAPATVKEKPKSLSEAKTEAKRFLRAK
ncbi:MAG: hypothetical protein IJY20_01735 [Clostridia bacterium]|nr:hypothetical protein [Clostridia bacterium]